MSKEIKSRLFSGLVTGIFLIASIFVIINIITMNVSASTTIYWGISESTGSTTIAESGCSSHNHEGKCDGCSVSVWQGNRVVYLSGGSQWTNGNDIDIQNTTGNSCLDLSADAGFRIQADLWILNDANTYHVIVDKYKYESGNGYGYTFYLTNDRLRLSVYAGANGYGDIQSTNTVPTGEWVTVYGQWKGGATDEIEVYWDDGESTETTTTSYSYAPAVPSTRPGLCFGERSTAHGGYMPFYGYIDSVDITKY